MKTILFTVLVLISQGALAFSLKDARLNSQTNTLELDVEYSGGCQDHDFAIQVNNCTRANPMACTAQVLEDDRGDTCRGYIKETIKVPADEFTNKSNLQQLILLDDQNSAVIVHL